MYHFPAVVCADMTLSATRYSTTSPVICDCAHMTLSTTRYSTTAVALSATRYSTTSPVQPTNGTQHSSRDLAPLLTGLAKTKNRHKHAVRILPPTPCP